jgi:hypothetical protein
MVIPLKMKSWRIPPQIIQPANMDHVPELWIPYFAGLLKNTAAKGGRVKFRE